MYNTKYFVSFVIESIMELHRGLRGQWKRIVDATMGEPDNT